LPFGKKKFSTEQALGSVSVVSKWAHAIGVGDSLNTVLADFQDLVRADTVQVIRQMRNFDRTRIIARQEKSAGKLFERTPRSFVPALLGDLLHRTNLGSLFLLTDMPKDNEAHANLDQFGLSEVCVVSLCNEHEFSDFLEFQFERPLPTHNRQLLEMLGSVLSRSWRDRTQGVAAAHLASLPFPAASTRVATFENILSSHNPADLTRSEFRVCMLVQEGRLPDELVEILKISKSTFRTHLRAIYLKTGVSGHVALVHLLHRSSSEVSAIPLQRSVLH
jgi:DNA-binding CsgD family transcriptional regulator